MAYAVPVINGKFSFNVDSFYVESSGHNLHRRAPLSELQALFQPAAAGASTSNADRVGHWYEAQLMHYGLPPSKNKAVAKMRLLDAVRAGNLAVPKDILKIEADLKKEWKKREKENRAGGAKKAAEPKPQPAKDTNKRKRGDDGDADDGATTQAAKGTKKAKPAKSTQTAKRGGSTVGSKKATDSTSDKKDNQPARKQTVKRSGSAVGQKKNSTTDDAADKGETKSVRKPKTARCGGAAVGPRKETSKDSTDGPPKRTKQTARRSRPFFGGTRIMVPNVEEEDAEIVDFPEADPMDIDDSHEFDQGSPDSSPRPLPPLGLVNGVYQIESDDLDGWEMYSQDDFELILCLSGDSMWGAYDFGMHSGILHLPERPYSASYKKLPFEWRGRENSEGQMSFGPNCKGWIRFLGDGEIEGEIDCYGQARFRGWRISGDETQPPRDVRSMRDEWNGYNEQQYERERVGRWGKSSW